MYLFIINPVSGNGKGKRIWRKVEKVLVEREIRYHFLFTESPGDGIHKVKDWLTEHASEVVQGVIAVGGDGTLHDVINGLVQVDQPPPFGFIPSGSGNDFARALSLGDWREALEHVLTGLPKAIDVGQINGDLYFIDTVGAGFDGEVSHHANLAHYKAWLNRFNLGKLTYVFSLLRILTTFRRSRLTIRTETGERTWEKAWLIAVANINCYGGGMRICPDAVPSDGKFQVCVVHSITALALLQVFPKVYKGTHIGHPAVELFDSREVEIEFEHPYYFQSDGEIKGRTPLHVKILKERLQAILPANHN